MDLTQERLRRLLDYEPATGLFRWSTSKGSAIFGAVAGTLNRGYIRVRIGGKAYMAHRLAFLYVEGEWPPEQVDHLDGNGSNNIWANLRHSNSHLNMANQPVHRRKLNHVPGVNKSKHQTWHACVNVNSERYNLGIFDDWFDAVCARKSAENKYQIHQTV